MFEERVPPPGEAEPQEWFIAGFDRRYMKMLATFILSRSPAGTFFVREKKDLPGAFALSAKESSTSMLTFLIAKSNDPTMHWTKRSRSGWTLRGSSEVFGTITELVQYFCAETRPELGIKLAFTTMPSFKMLQQSKLRRQKRMSAESVASKATEVGTSITSPFIKFAAPTRTTTRAQHVRLNYVVEDSVVDEDQLDPVTKELIHTSQNPSSSPHTVDEFSDDGFSIDGSDDESITREIPQGRGRATIEEISDDGFSDDSENSDFDC